MLVPDKRLLRVYVDHAQRRVKKPRVGVVCRGWDFLEGSIEGLWVNPISGVLQSQPNSEEVEYQTLNTGRYQKLALADVTTVDLNTPAGTFAMSGAMGMHPNSAIKFSGTNTAGAGVVTLESYPANTGFNVSQYVHDRGNDTGTVLIEFGWNTTATGTAGESVRVYGDGRLEIWRDGKMQCRGSFGGSSYEFGSVRGGSYAKASDRYVSFRAEIRSPFLILTSSVGGIFQYSCPWATAQYNADGSVLVEAEPVVRASRFWWYVPKGGITVVSSPVAYVPTGEAVSAEFALSEPPDGGGPFVGKAIPSSGSVAVSLVAPDSVSAFDDTTNRCRIKVAASAAPVWIDGASCHFDRAIEETEDDETDITPYLRAISTSLEDGPEGFTVTLDIRADAPASLLDEIENRPFRVDLVPHPDDLEPRETVVLLDGVGGPPEWVDGRTLEQRVLRIRVTDRLSLLKDAEASETVVFDGTALCRPVGAGDSAVAHVLRQGGFENSEIDLPDLGFMIEHQPPQKAGDWAFAVNAGMKWWDALQALFDLAPSLIWGVRPTADGPKFYVIDPEDVAAPQATLYRRPEDVVFADGEDPEDWELREYPFLYDEHRRTKLPIEGNLVRVLGLDPSTGKPIIESRSDDDSRDPQGVRNGRWLGNTRTVKYQSATLVTQPMVRKVADSLFAAVRQRQYVEPWKSFMLFKEDGAPLWRGDKVLLKGGLPDGGDSEVRISSMTPEFVDESGQGLQDGETPRAAIPIRLVEYTGGALIGLGGSGEKALVSRQKMRIQDGGWNGQGVLRFPQVSPGVTILS